jgi:CheY-like chemotaxis protein
MARLLLVEDNEMNRDMLSRRLTRRGYEIVIAVDGEEGVRRAGSDAPDLVLMDLSLPVLDGWEATRRLKQSAATRAIPVIALTAHAMSTDSDRARDAGCDDFDTKPVEFERLVGKIESLLKRQARYSMVVPEARFTDLAALRAFVIDACNRHGVAPLIREDLALATDEACTNVIEHGYAAPGPITLIAELRSDVVQVLVLDRGTSFWPNDAPAADTAAAWTGRAIGGLGWHLIRSVVDDCTYEQAADGWNCLTLTRQLNPNPSEAHD